MFRHYPGGELLWLTPMQALSFVFGSWWPPTGSIGALKNKFSSQFLPLNLPQQYRFTSTTVYEKYGSTCLSSVTFWGSTAYFWIADADTMKTITFDGSTFTKDIETVISIVFVQSRHY